MVVGGDPSSNYRVEVVDLSGNNVPCSSVSSNPSKYGSAGAFVDDMLLICGGYGDHVASTVDCNSYDVQVRINYS